MTGPGQNGGGTIENNDLSSYCASASGIDVIVLARIIHGAAQKLVVTYFGFFYSALGEDHYLTYSFLPQVIGVKFFSFVLDYY